MSEKQDRYSAAYNAGLDCARNGADTTNCNFRHFATKEQMHEWERGKRDGELTPVPQEPTP